MENTLLQLSVGGYFALEIVKNVFGFIKGNGKDNTLSILKDAGRTESDIAALKETIDRLERKIDGNHEHTCNRVNEINRAIGAVEVALSHFGSEVRQRLTKLEEWRLIREERLPTHRQ